MDQWQASVLSLWTVGNHRGSLGRGAQERLGITESKTDNLRYYFTNGQITLQSDFSNKNIQRETKETTRFESIKLPKTLEAAFAQQRDKISTLKEDSGAPPSGELLRATSQRDFTFEVWKREAHQPDISAQRPGLKSSKNPERTRNYYKRGI